MGRADFSLWLWSAWKVKTAKCWNQSSFNDYIFHGSQTRIKKKADSISNQCWHTFSASCGEERARLTLTACLISSLCAAVHYSLFGLLNVLEMHEDFLPRRLKPTHNALRQYRLLTKVNTYGTTTQGQTKTGSKTSWVRSWNDENTFSLLPFSRGHRVQSVECVEDSSWLLDYRTCCISTVEEKTLMKELLSRSHLNHSGSRNRDTLASVFSQSGKWP